MGGRFGEEQRGRVLRDVFMGLHFRVREKFGVRETPRNLQGWPQLRLLAIVDRVPELAIYCNQIGIYLNCHQRVFIQ